MLNLRLDLQESADRNDEFRKEFSLELKDLKRRLRDVEKNLWQTILLFIAAPRLIH